MKQHMKSEDRVGIASLVFIEVLTVVGLIICMI